VKVFESELAMFQAQPVSLGPVGASPDMEILEIQDHHIVGAAMRTIQVPVGEHNNGIVLYVDHPLWPELDKSLDRDEAIAKIVEDLSNQRNLPNCYFLTGLNCTAYMAWELLKTRIVALPDNKIGVYGFYQGKQDQPLTFVMDYNMAMNGVDLGPSGAIAYKAAEKMWAFARFMTIVNGEVVSPNDYDKQAWGTMNEWFKIAGIPTVGINPSDPLAAIDKALAEGKGVTFATPVQVTHGFSGRHAYTVKKGRVSVNPWGKAFPPMYIALTPENKNNIAANYLCIADFSKAYSVGESKMIIKTPKFNIPVDASNPMNIKATVAKDTYFRMDFESDAEGVTVTNSYWQGAASKKGTDEIQATIPGNGSYTLAFKKGDEIKILTVNFTVNATVAKVLDYIEATPVYKDGSRGTPVKVN
jgi:hypothetical protein